MEVSSGEPEDVQARKRKRYVWKVRVLAWGGFMFLFMEFFDWYSKGYIQIQMPPVQRLLWMTIPGLIIWSVAGYWWGVTTWRHRRNSDL